MSTPKMDSTTIDSVTAMNARYRVRARRLSPRTTARHPSRAMRRPYTMPSTTPDRTTNTSAAVTTQNRSYENQLNTDCSFEWFTMTQVIARPRSQSMRRSRPLDDDECETAGFATLGGKARPVPSAQDDACREPQRSTS